MSITLPTLDEIEAYWEAHPEVVATTCDETACVIAWPLRERYPDAAIGVIPRRIGQYGRLVGTGLVKTLPFGAHDFLQVELPDDLNYLAKEFDALAEERYNLAFAEEQQPISAACCLMLIRRVKEEV